LTKKGFVVLYRTPSLRGDYNEDMFHEFEAEDDPASIIKELTDHGLSWEFGDRDTRILEVATTKSGSQLLKEARLKLVNHHPVPIDTPDTEIGDLPALASLSIKPSVCQKETTECDISIP